MNPTSSIARATRDGPFALLADDVKRKGPTSDRSSASIVHRCGQDLRTTWGPRLCHATWGLIAKLRHQV